MQEFKFIKIPSKDYVALGFSPETLIETYINKNCELVIRKANDGDLEEFLCDGECNNCPVAILDCDGDCFACPCYACCENSNYKNEKREKI